MALLTVLLAIFQTQADRSSDNGKKQLELYTSGHFVDNQEASQRMAEAASALVQSSESEVSINAGKDRAKQGESKSDTHQDSASSQMLLAGLQDLARNFQAAFQSQEQKQQASATAAQHQEIKTLMDDLTAKFGSAILSSAEELQPLPETPGFISHSRFVQQP